jgi:hypothetical protein
MPTLKNLQVLKLSAIPAFLFIFRDIIHLNIHTTYSDVSREVNASNSPQISTYTQSIPRQHLTTWASKSTNLWLITAARSAARPSTSAPMTIVPEAPTVLDAHKVPTERAAGLHSVVLPARQDFGSPVLSPSIPIDREKLPLLSSHHTRSLAPSRRMTTMGEPTA